QTSSLKPYVLNVTLEKIIIDLEDEVVNLLKKEKANLETIESLKSKGFESSESAVSELENQNENDCLVVEKERDKVENPNVIAPGMFKLNVSHVGKLCDKGLKVAFRKSTCFVRKEDGVDLLTDDRSSNLYTIALNEVALNSSTCLLTKASSLQSWLWHQHHLCSACEQGKIHQKYHKSKTAFASNKHLYLLHMDLCGPMRVQIINGKRYVLVVVDDYSRYTWVFFLHSKDEAYEVIISFIKRTQVNLQLQVQRVRTDNGTEFKNKTLAKFFDEVGITQQFSAARTPQQNGVVERRNRTLVKATRTTLTFTNLPSFLWAEAITIACFIQNRSIIHKRFDKTPYELINKRKPNIKFFRVFGCRCYFLNDYEDVGKLKAKGDIRVFVGYLKESAAFRIYNKQTRKIHESVNVNFDEISEMAFKQFSLEPDVIFSMIMRMLESSRQKGILECLLDIQKNLLLSEFTTNELIMKSSIMNVETSINEEVFHEVSESFQRESSSSSLNDDVQQSPEEVILPSSNTQSIPINMVPNGDDASTSHNVFMNDWRMLTLMLVYRFMIPLRDADWVSAMQEELDQFTRLKVWR
nr:retrovirus-related Pol polyprotein from transposon TNT 1-94 [Tanacetum cinerariifolium]